MKKNVFAESALTFLTWALVSFRTYAGGTELIFEAESGVISSGAVQSNYPGYTGTGFVKLANDKSAYLEWTVDLPNNGVWEIQFRYANGSQGDRVCEIRMDGNLVEVYGEWYWNYLDFFSTGDWSAWKYSKVVRLNLSAGSHKLRITEEVPPAPNLDHVRFTLFTTQQTGAITVGAWATWGIDFTDWNGQPGSVRCSFKLFDSSWKELASGNQTTFTNLPSGEYYAYASAYVWDWIYPVHNMWSDLWLGEYYQDAVSKSGAVPITVHAPDTTKGISIKLDHYRTYVVVETVPGSLPFTMDGTVYDTGPVRFGLAESDIHTLSVDSSIAMPDGRIYTFKGWSNGGKRVQNYVVPPPKFWDIVDTVSAVFDTARTGTMKLNLKAEGFSQGMEQKTWIVSLYRSAGQLVRWENISTSASLTEQNVVLKDLPAGRYYIKASVYITEPGPWSLYIHSPWLAELYDNQDERNWTGADLVWVGAFDTARVSIGLEWATYTTLAVNPDKGFSIYLDKNSWCTPPITFAWRQGDVHTIDVNEYYTLSGDPGRYVFREWRHGGNRVQDYAVPAPIFAQSTDTLVARFDHYSSLEIRSRYGNPLGAGWYKTWAEVSFSVEDSVIEYSDASFQFLKASDTVAKDSLLHLFDKWEGLEGHLAYSGKNNPAKFTIYGNTVEKAVWRDQYPLAVSPNDTSMGKVSAAPPGLWHDRDSTVTLNAVPKTGHRFLRWEGSILDTVSLVNVKMDTSKKIKAVFEEITGSAVRPAPIPSSGKPGAFRLYPNFPNPFNPETEIRFDVPVSERVRIEVFSLTGKRVAVLADGAYGPGTYQVRWKGTDVYGKPAGSGIYFCRMSAGGFMHVSKMHLIR